MEIRITRFQVKKRYPLSISRGTSAATENLLVEVAADGMTGWGEMAPAIAAGETAATAEADLRQWSERLADLTPWDGQRIERLLEDAGGGSGARAALDIALHDWRGKRAGQPLWRTWSLDRQAIVPTSFTLGLASPEQVRERIPEVIARTGIRILKIKLGSREGVEADREMFSACLDAAPEGVTWRVDANGGWDVEDARLMLRWLAERGVEFVEQPLAKGREGEMPALYRDSPLPLYADESVRVAADVPKVADRVHGVNVKLMKSGGITEAFRVIHAARAHGLKVMIGCMSETALGIAAAAHLSPLADALDLDSHLNLLDDPFEGLRLEEGRVLPGDGPGLGITRSLTSDPNSL